MMRSAHPCLLLKRSNRVLYHLPTSIIGSVVSFNRSFAIHTHKAELHNQSKDFAPTSFKLEIFSNRIVSPPPKNTMSQQAQQSSSSSAQTPVIVATTDLCDEHMASPKPLFIVEPGLFHSYGGATSFYGQITTIKCYESNSLVRSVLSSPPPSAERVLVVDGANSKRVALLGDMIAQLAVDSGWKGILVNGLIRDSTIIKTMPVGVFARGTYPLKSRKDHPGEQGCLVAFGGVEFVPEHWLYADEDGIVVSEKSLHGGKTDA